MKRRANVAPYVDARGVRLVSISTKSQHSFAHACLVTMQQRDGRNRFFLLRTASSIDVPADIVEATRDRLADHSKFVRYNAND